MCVMTCNASTSAFFSTFKDAGCCCVQTDRYDDRRIIHVLERTSPMMASVLPALTREYETSVATTMMISVVADSPIRAALASQGRSRRMARMLFGRFCGVCFGRDDGVGLRGFVRTGRPGNAPWLKALAEGVEEPHGEEGRDADEHGVLIRVGGDVPEEVLQLADLHRVAGQLLRCGGVHLCRWVVVSRWWVLWLDCRVDWLADCLHGGVAVLVHLSVECSAVGTGVCRTLVP